MIIIPFCQNKRQVILFTLKLNFDFSQLWISSGFTEIPQLHGHFNFTFQWESLLPSLIPCNNSEKEEREKKKTFLVFKEKKIE